MIRKTFIPTAAVLAVLSAASSARAEVSVTSARETAVITAASLKVGPNSEVLVLIDRTTHIMRVYSFRNTELLELDGSPVALAREFNPPAAGTKPATSSVGFAPAEYLIIPVSSGESSLLCVLNSQTRKLLVGRITGQRLTLSKPVDLKSAFELK